MMLCPCWGSLILNLRMALYGLETVSSNKAYCEPTCCDHFLPQPSMSGSGLSPSLLALNPSNYQDSLWDTGLLMTALTLV